MKKLSTLLIIAFALVLGLTQCKKKVDTIATPNNLGKTVHITVNVGGDKHQVFPNTGAVVYTDGDKIYVGDGSKYLGTLTYGSGAFSGDITAPAVGDYLYFYFLGGLTLDSPSAETTSYTVSIADQSSQFPVLSLGRSSSPYTTSSATYGCTLENKCALVEFALIEGTTEAVAVSDMQTVAAIDFANPDNAIAANGTTGAITLNSQSETSKWAILLPSTSETSTVATIAGVDYNVTVPQITANGYLTGDAAVAVDNTAPAPSYVFSVSDTKTVRFSPGNLQYKDGEGWRFAQNQYDYINAWNTNDWVDLFGWGTWGEGKNPLNTSTIHTGYQWSTDFQGTLNGHNDWYTLTVEEWRYLFETRSNAAQKVGYATVGGNNGIIILPDDFTDPMKNNGSGAFVPQATTGWTANVYTAGDCWDAMEAAGAVFLPAAGSRNGTDVNNVGVCGDYWSASARDEGNAYGLYIFDSNVSPYGSSYRDEGQSVRLVR